MRRLTPSGRRTAVLSGAVAVGLAGAAVVTLGFSGGTPAMRAAYAARATSSAPASTPAAAVAAPRAHPTTPAALATPSSTVHLVIPAVHLDLPLLALTPRRGVIDPPTLTAGYWIEPYGEPVATPAQARNTLYIAAHTTGSGHNGFDPLLAADHRGSALAPGDVVQVRTRAGTVKYTVERAQRYAKDQLPKAADVWEASPGRLVLITCFQRADGRASTENLVVFAKS